MHGPAGCLGPSCSFFMKAIEGIAYSVHHPNAMQTTDTPSAVRTVHAFLDRLGALDLDGFMALWTEGAVQTNPFAPENFPAQYEGKEQIRSQYQQLVSQYQAAEFSDVDVRATERPGEAVAEFRGRYPFKDRGGAYEQTYLCVFKVDGDGRITHYTEYFDPLKLKEAFDL